MKKNETFMMMYFDAVERMYSSADPESAFTKGFLKSRAAVSAITLHTSAIIILHSMPFLTRSIFFAP